MMKLLETFTSKKMTKYLSAQLLPERIHKLFVEFRYLSLVLTESE